MYTLKLANGDYEGLFETFEDAQRQSMRYGKPTDTILEVKIKVKKEYKDAWGRNKEEYD